jgi:GMP synthase-like glutamine amidotransferase
VACCAALQCSFLICRRAQILAMALGGSVGRNPSGRFFIGPERLELTRALAQRRDFALARVRRR